MQPKNYTYEPELFEIDLPICIKMDLRLIAYNRWYYIKTNQTQPSNPRYLTVSKDWKYVKLSVTAWVSL